MFSYAFYAPISYGINPEFEAAIQGDSKYNHMFLFQPHRAQNAAPGINGAPH